MLDIILSIFTYYILKAKKVNIISLLLFCFCIFSITALKLPTTIGLLTLSSLFLLQINKFRRKINPNSYILIINVCIISLFTSFILIGLNIVEYFVNSKKDKIIDLSNNVEMNYGIKEPLGFRFKPNKEGSNKKMVKSKKSGERIIVIDTKYRIDERGNRKLPLSESLDNSKSILFLGGSLTFGEALNDNETLPYYVSRKLGVNTINAGMNGYGAHQALQILQNKKIYKERISSQKVTHIVYRALMEHINRSAGYAQWDYYGPCYEFSNTKNKIEFKGSFSECKKLSFVEKFKSKIIQFLKSSNEPWTSNFANKIQFKKYNNRKFLKNDYIRFLKIIEEINLISKNINAKFIIIIEDFDTKNPKKCLVEDTYHTKKFISDLERISIPFLKTSEIYRNKNCEDLQVKYDGHPSALANKLLAEKLINYLDK